MLTGGSFSAAMPAAASMYALNCIYFGTAAAYCVHACWLEQKLPRRGSVF